MLYNTKYLKYCPFSTNYCNFMSNDHCTFNCCGNFIRKESVQTLFNLTLKQVGLIKGCTHKGGPCLIITDEKIPVWIFVWICLNLCFQNCFNSLVLRFSKSVKYSSDNLLHTEVHHQLHTQDLYVLFNRVGKHYK